MGTLRTKCIKNFESQPNTNPEQETNDKKLCELFGTTLEQVERDVRLYESGDLSRFSFAQIDCELISKANKTSEQDKKANKGFKEA